MFQVVLVVPFTACACRVGHVPSSHDWTFKNGEQRNKQNQQRVWEKDSDKMVAIRFSALDFEL